MNRYLLMQFKHFLKGKPKPWLFKYSEIGKKSNNKKRTNLL